MLVWQFKLCFSAAETEIDKNLEKDEWENLV